MKTLTLRAEEALLGAMLTDPELVRAVGRYLNWPDFTDERHRAAYAAMVSALREEGPPGLPWRRRVEASAPGLPSWYFGRLAAACPEPAHGLSYGRLVLQASIRRSLSRAGWSIGDDGSALEREAARLADEAASMPIRRLAYHAACVGRELRALARVFNPDTARSLAGPPPAARGRARQEERILAALLQGHRDTGRILRLPADGFTDPERRDIFRAVRRLHASAQPVDALTVDWETARGQDNEGATGHRDAATARGRQPSYATRLAAADIGAFPAARTASSLLGVRAGDRAAEAGTSPQHPTPSGPRLLRPPPGPAGPGPTRVQGM